MGDAFDEEFDTGVDELEDETPPQRVNRQSAADSMLDQFSDESEEQVEDEEPTEYMGEVDDRLEIATYYRSLLRNPLFNENTRAAKIVEREHRAFIRERLEILLSIREASTVQPAVSPFTSEEVEGLKILIGQMRKKGMLTTPGTAPTPTPQPVPQAVTPPVRTAPQPAPVRRAPTQAPQRQAAPTPKAPVKPARQLRRRSEAPPPVVRTEIVTNPNTGKTFERKIQQAQKPAGALPFPRDLAQAVQASAAPALMQGNSIIARLANQAIVTPSSE